MKKLLLIIPFIFIYCQTYSQTSPRVQFMRNIGYTKTLMNENLEAYTVWTQQKRNGIELEPNMNNPSVDNPFYIIIKSDENSGWIRIRNKNNPDDIVINFDAIFKKEDEDGEGITHLFMINDPDLEYDVFYSEEYYTNDTLFISVHDKSDKNGITVQYTISEL
ncbi:hypothetical protein LB465_07090 [Salegentibacter sp. LM13S]|uniref:hypothetical protein n=1 Tax=Salegentibacter lacus TaxID=2873599 RepID=UPI001CCDE59F|nr:hypothetical protein [Salegentibacter lacus]MBZ9630541.1 hypothetical protein [Salegentibacter lacus]